MAATGNTPNAQTEPNRAVGYTRQTQQRPVQPNQPTVQPVAPWRSADGVMSYRGNAAGGGFSNTAEGKVIAASYLDNYNIVVRALKADADLMARAEKFKATGLSGADTKAGATFADGVVLGPKIDNIKIFAAAKDDAKVLGLLKKSDDLVFLGEEVDGFVKVQGSTHEGWVKKSLVAKR